MKLNHITQKKLSLTINVAKTTVSRWVTGILEPKCEDILKLCLILDTDPNDLLGYDEISDKIKDDYKFKK